MLRRSLRHGVMQGSLTVLVGAIVVARCAMSLPAGSEQAQAITREHATTSAPTTVHATSTTSRTTAKKLSKAVTTGTRGHKRQQSTTSVPTTVAVTSTTSPAPTTTSTLGTSPSPIPSNGNFITRSGTGLSLNGQPYNFAGFNIYDANSIWGMPTACGQNMGSLSSSPTGDGLDQNLAKINAYGALQVFRAWFFESLAVSSSGAITWTPFDNTLAVARSHGMHVVVTLDNQWSDCVHSGYKGLSWYQGGYRNSDGDGPLSYRDYVRAIVTRYANDPTIAMWQFMNEAEAKSSQSGSCSESTAATAMRTWADDIGGLIKSIDPNHLTSIGTIGSGQCGTAGNYKYLHASPYVDLCEYHDYGSTNALPNSLATDLASCGAAGLNKPLFVGESGIKPCDVGGTYQDRANAFAAKFQVQFGAGVVGELPWAWDGTQSTLCDYTIGAIDAAGHLDPTVLSLAAAV
jgi:mannan endo-1,4-beta-mannosidase